MSQPDTPNDTVNFEGGNPIFRVRDLAASITYYLQVLGFKLDWEYTPGGGACVSRGRFSFVRPGRNDALVHAAENLIQAVHLGDVQFRLAAELSHGQQRQLEIALALAGAPRFILFDEPAAGLSPGERAELVEILSALPSHIGYIIIEHDMDVALRVVERVTMMHNGRIFKEGPPQEIESDPEVQELYLGGGYG